VTLSLPNYLGPEWEQVRERFPEALAVIERVGSGAGSFAAAREALDSTSCRQLVIYGDSLLKVDLAQLARTHAVWRRERGVTATVLYHRPADLYAAGANGRTYHGIMSCSQEGEISRFVEKPLVTELAPGFDLANAAVFVIEREAFEDVRFKDASDFSYDFFQPAVANGWLSVYGVDIGDQGYRHDLGTPERLLEANIKVLSGEWSGTVPGRQIRPGVWCGEGVQIDGAAIVPPVALGQNVTLKPGCTVGPRAVVGDACTIAENAFVRDAVLLHGCKVAPRGRVTESILGAHCDIGQGVSLPDRSCVGDYCKFASAWG
jgi:mannose-1-phosphate guanylyltransferase/phosphomannomutase